MSYFPRGDLLERHSSNSLDTAFIELSSSHEDQQEWATAYSTGVYGFAAAQSDLFKDNSSLGLGLLSFPGSAAQPYLGPDQGPSQVSNTAPVFWPGQLNTTRTPIVHPQPVRAASWNGACCNPLSTLKPEAVWSPPQPFAFEEPTHDITPALSQYSPSPHPSVVSTPYARSDSAVFSVSTPPIKVENNPEPPIPEIPRIHEPLMEQLPQVVKPEDLVVRRTTPIKEGLNACHISSSPQAADLKPPVLRSMRRRAYSSEDILEDRKKRTYTKLSQATCECRLCGKLFQRTYNLRAHMETHDPERSHPHICWYDGCDKRFVRRTDLVRHEQSVHLKERNYACPLCNSTFARKDTLRRHVDDGCPRRLEVRKRSTPKARRASSASTMKRSPRYKREESPSLDFSWEDIPEFR